jgi:hypothetical protein
MMRAYGTAIVSRAWSKVEVHESEMVIEENGTDLE